MIERAVPIVLHPGGAPLRLLACTHPEVGAQLVTGTRATDEPPLRAAARALWAQSGLQAISATGLTESDGITGGERWHFVLIRVRPPVRAHFQYANPGSGAVLLKFWWHPLDAAAPFVAPYAAALDAVRGALSPPA